MIRNDSIDSLRALGALLVFFSHSHVLPLTPLGYGAFWGVYLFFLVSGYCMGSTQSNQNSFGRPQNFLIKRVARLYPAFWLSIFLYVLLVPGNTATNVLKNMTMFPRLFGGEYINSVFWTLEIELIYYLFLFFVCLLKKGNNFFLLNSSLLICLMLSLMAAIIQVAKLGDPPYKIFLFFSLFLYGNIRFIRGARFNFWNCFVYLSTIFLITFLIYNKTDLNSKLTLAQAFGEFFVPVIIFEITLKYKILKIKFLELVGLISYSVYLFHMPAIFILQKYSIFRYETLIFSVLALTLTLLISSLVYLVIEFPIIRFVKSKLS